ncbi:MAG: glutamine synthetase family protein [Pikeienuella sp.]
MSFAAALAGLLERHPEIEAAEVFVVDLNGLARGKRIPVAKLAALAQGKVRMPVSSLGLDVFGADVPESGIAIERGDPDGALVPVAETLTPMLWAARPTAQVICSLTEADGGPCAYDPRTVLARLVDQAAAQGLRATMAFELEFYLIDPAAPAPPAPLGHDRAQIYELERLRAFEPVMAGIERAAAACNAPVETAICEFGPGQFELNLGHVACPLTAADRLVLLRRAIRGAARAAGLDASFMAKPYGDQAGSGLHLHVSLEGPSGALFDAGGGPVPAAAAGQALAGLCATMPEAMLVWAPHANSYRRFMPGSYAPLCAAWGLDNRGAALRMPETSGPGARIEHRVSGADANPYLVAAAVLAGVLDGLEAAAPPPPPVTTEAVPADGRALPLTWAEAERRFCDSAAFRARMGSDLVRVFAAMKRQERATLLARVSDVEYAAYLRTV